MMTNETRRAELETANNESAIARAKWTAAIEKGDRRTARKAAEELEFWSNKSAFLFNVKL